LPRGSVATAGFMSKVSNGNGAMLGDGGKTVSMAVGARMDVELILGRRVDPRRNGALNSCSQARLRRQPAKY
jgi:hypothetical protein